MQPAYHQQVASNATVTTTGVIGAAWASLSQQPKQDLIIYLRIANAPTGTSPNLTVKLQGSQDGTNWADIPNGAFAAQTAATGAGVALRVALTDVIDPQFRIFGTVTGTTPSFTGVYVDVIESSDNQ